MSCARRKICRKVGNRNFVIIVDGTFVYRDDIFIFNIAVETIYKSYNLICISSPQMSTILAIMKAQVYYIFRFMHCVFIRLGKYFRHLSILFISNNFQKNCFALTLKNITKYFLNYLELLILSKK